MIPSRPPRTLLILIAFVLLLPPALLGQSKPNRNKKATADNTSAAANTDAAIKNVFWQPNQLSPGSVIFFTVEVDRAATAVSGTFLGKDLLFFKSTKPNIWYSLAGLDIEVQPGTHDVTITALTRGLETRTLKRIDVDPPYFKSSDITVDENFVNPDDASKKQIAADQVFKDRAFSHLTPTPLWSGNFIKPVRAPATPSFGMSRLFNEELVSQHRGTDFPAKAGLPVSASNSGTVVLARNLFYEGNCVMIDHGQRFLTIYMHLSRIDVKDGDEVKKGQRLGLTGATGRTTGPHLHMGVRWQGAYLDPTKLLALTLPETRASHAATPSPKRPHNTRRKR